MASVSVVPTLGTREPSENSAGVDRLPDEMNDMKLRDDKVDVWLWLCVCKAYPLVLSALEFHIPWCSRILYFSNTYIVVPGNGTSYS